MTFNPEDLKVGNVFRHTEDRSLNAEQYDTLHRLFIIRWRSR